MTTANSVLHDILDRVINEGKRITTRNSEVYRLPLQSAQFTSLPLVTLKKTAWKKALTEMEWFMSGETKCPEVLRDWWDGQLNPEGHYLHGYSHQLRYSPRSDGSTFDQIQYILDGLRNNPLSRRLCLTTWNSGDMANITQTNDNPATPSSCHLSFAQFYVNPDKTLDMFVFQRSADLLLGLCHNWVQHFSMLTYFAHHAGLKVGNYSWTGGDCHLYNEPSHIQCAAEIINAHHYIPIRFDLKYTPSEGERFLAKDFSVVGKIPEPVTKIRPKLL